VLRVGLTGGIACGKSHVLRRLGEHGIATLDLDRVAHEVLAPGGPAYDEVVAAFGRGVLAEGGAIERKALAALVFADSGARFRLNAIVHPKVRAEAARTAARLADQGQPLLVTDAALLVESGVHLRFDRLVVVHCSREEQLRRIQARDGLDPAQAAARLEAQMPVVEKRRFAHYEVGTGGSFRETDRASDDLTHELRRLVSSPLRQADQLLERGTACLLAAQASGPHRLAPTRLLEDITAAGGLEMERVAGLLDSSPGRPWYRRSPSPGPEQGLEAVVVPTVLWVLARRGADVDLTASVVASVARLFCATSSEVSAACLFAVALSEAALGDDWTPSPDRLGSWLELAARWGGARPSQRMIDIVQAGISAPAPGTPGKLLLSMARPQPAAPGDVRSGVERLLRLGAGGR